MTEPTPTISVNVDVTNPGQFFACCGLLELADRLWPGAEGWFADRQFHIACAGTLAELLNKLMQAKFNSSLTDNELKLLGTLLSAEKSSLTEQQAREKQRLKALWLQERIHLVSPYFDISMDWWRDEFTLAKTMKTWAAKQLVINIVRPLLNATVTIPWSPEMLPQLLMTTSKVAGLPFYFDASAYAQSTPRDYGFRPSLRKEPKNGIICPALELLAFIGLQRSRPKVSERHKDKILSYWIWSHPTLVTLVPAVISGLLSHFRTKAFEFRMIDRTEYMKAVQTALPTKRRTNDE